jgi:FtsZ-binding cell division protein ZapB
MGASNWASIIVAAIALFSAMAAGRAASNASKYSARTQAETEAYNRARKMDIETIERQDKEIEEIREENKAMQQKIRELKIDNDRLRRRISHLEQQVGGPNEQSTSAE